MLLITFSINFPASAGMKSLSLERTANLFTGQKYLSSSFELFKCQNVHFGCAIWLHLISSTNERKKLSEFVAILIHRIM